ncbi:MAG: energy-coupled thiamine transporter ThiT [Clostridiales bacterium]|nr:energy-coupled thiamine transporter ThiT [Clostridiales bacterium]
MLEDIKTYFANFDGATNTCRTIALWVTVALLLAFVATRLYAAIVRKQYDEQTYNSAVKLMNGGWIVVALAAAVCYIVTFASCYFVDVANDNDYLFPILFYPMLVFAIAVVGSAIALFIKPNKIAKIVCAAVVGSAFIAVLVCIIVYYTSGQAVENNYDTDVLSNLGLYLSSVLLAVGVVAAAFFLDRKSKPMDTRTITYAAVCVALSFALSYVRLFKMPMGGSITFASMLPLMLFAFMFGSRKGVAVGAIYGLLQAIQDPWIIHPAQFALDYVVAFAAIGLTGIIRELGLFKGNMRAQFILGATVACGIRFISHYFAGVFAFGVYGAGYAADYNISALANEYFYSFVYQCLYIIPELVIVIVAALLVLASQSFRKQIERRIAAGSIGEKVAQNADVSEAPAAETENAVDKVSDKAE